MCISIDWTRRTPTLVPEGSPFVLTPDDTDPFAGPLTIHASNWHPKEAAAVDQSGAVPMPGEGSQFGPLPQMYPPDPSRGYVTPVETPPSPGSLRQRPQETGALAGFQAGFGDEPLGPSPETMATAKEWGLSPMLDPEIRVGGAALDAFNRAFYGVIGAGAGVAGKQFDSPALERDINAAGQAAWLNHPSFEPAVAERPAEPTAPADKSYPLTAFHGTPHDFDKFRWDETTYGTGEGAHAYGHGLYFAENEGVARSYRDTLVGKDLEGPEYHASGALAQYGDRQAAEQALIDRAHMTNNEPGKRSYEEAAQLVRHGWSAPGGHIYQVGINAEPEHFLDWDKPLKDQSPLVQQAAVAARFPNNPKMASAALQSPFMELSGADLVHELKKTHSNPVEASAALKKAGVPGIKFLDAGSRFQPTQAAHLSDQISQLEEMLRKTQKDDPKYASIEKALTGRHSELQELRPTRNFVIFDDKTVDILKKYGLAGIGLGIGGVGAGMLGNPGRAEAASQPTNSPFTLTPDTGE